MIKPIIEDTYKDAAEVVRISFASESAVRVLYKEMQNPLRRLATEIGFIGYEDSNAVCLQVFILRNYYCAREKILAKIGAMSCRLPNSSVEPFIDVKAAIARPIAGSVLKVTNSMNEQSSAIAKKTHASRRVPESCSQYVWRAVRPLECLMYFIRRKILKTEVPKWKHFDSSSSSGFQCYIDDKHIKRITEVSKEIFDSLMDRYIESNEGVVGSRRAEDLAWIFEDRIKSGSIVVLAAFDKIGPVGYIMMNGHGNGKRWGIVDWFAVGNKLNTLEALLKAGCKYLRKCTPAMMLETFGFPTWVQPLLQKYLPHKRNVGFSMTSWNVFNRADREKYESVIDTQKSWFFGPYDGDICL